MAYLFFGLFGLAVIVGTALSYVVTGGHFVVLGHPVDFDKLGAFFGGVTGPLLSFLALMAVVATLRAQNRAIQREAEARTAGEHVRWIDAIYHDIGEVLDYRLQATGGIQVTLRNVLDTGALPAAAVEADFTSRLDEFATLLGKYCSAVAIYRDNCDPLFDVQILVDRGARLLDRLKPFSTSLGGMSFAMIEFCDMHLKGESKRAQPEAMNRPTRH